MGRKEWEEVGFEVGAQQQDHPKARVSELEDARERTKECEAQGIVRAGGDELLQRINNENGGEERMEREE
jgi:hypothetical protein